jgi:hypothetical protein
VPAIDAAKSAKALARLLAERFATQALNVFLDLLLRLQLLSWLRALARFAHLCLLLPVQQDADAIGGLGGRQIRGEQFRFCLTGRTSCVRSRARFRGGISLLATLLNRRLRCVDAQKSTDLPDGYLMLTENVRLLWLSSACVLASCAYLSLWSCEAERLTGSCVSALSEACASCALVKFGSSLMSFQRSGPGPRDGPIPSTAERVGAAGRAEGLLGRGQSLDCWFLLYSVAPA